MRCLARLLVHMLTCARAGPQKRAARTTALPSDCNVSKTVALKDFCTPTASRAASVSLAVALPGQQQPNRTGMSRHRCLPSQRYQNGCIDSLLTLPPDSGPRRGLDRRALTHHRPDSPHAHARATSCYRTRFVGWPGVLQLVSAAAAAGKRRRRAAPPYPRWTRTLRSSSAASSGACIPVRG